MEPVSPKQSLEQVPQERKGILKGAKGIMQRMRNKREMGKTKG